MKETSISTHLVCSTIAGFVTAFVVSPVDVLKTRIMNSKKGAKYSGIVDCIVKTHREEGLGSFYKGFSASA